jgi:DNA processing protein
MHPGGARVRGLLALGDEELVAALAPRRQDRVLATVADFDPDHEARSLEERGIFTACRHGASYPRRLLDLHDPPAVLYGVGEPRTLAALEHEPAVAIVGTREPSSYGLEVAYGLGRGLGAAGITVVSGLALGIDGTAHRGSLDGGGPPVGVLGGGVDIPYPRTHLSLYRRVRDAGAVISELPPGTRAMRWAFPARNRIMAGLAAMTIVVEAADPSGSLITSDFAADLDRTVAAVPGRVTARVAAGPNRLIASGARVVTGPEDVLDELFGVGVRPERRSTPGRDGCDRVQRLLLAAVERGLGMDEICAASGLPAGEVRAALARLEASGRLSRDAFGSYARTAVR